jgi:hypothetical protein
VRRNLSFLIGVERQAAKVREVGGGKVGVLIDVVVTYVIK